MPVRQLRIDNEEGIDFELVVGIDAGIVVVVQVVFVLVDDDLVAAAAVFPFHLIVFVAAVEQAADGSLVALFEAADVDSVPELDVAVVETAAAVVVDAADVFVAAVVSLVEVVAAGLDSVEPFDSVEPLDRVVAFVAFLVFYFLRVEFCVALREFVFAQDSAALPRLHPSFDFRP